jgi:antirestriction protein ArdC
MRDPGSISAERGARSLATALLEAADAGIQDGRLPWHGRDTMPVNARTMRPYTAMNAFLLMAAADRLATRASARWATARQWAQAGRIAAPDVLETGDTRGVLLYRPMPIRGGTRVRYRTFAVYNESQLPGPPALRSLAGHGDVIVGVDAAVASAIQRLGVRIGSPGPPAYRPDSDTITMPALPPFASRRATLVHYATQVHELAHATGHRTRLNRLSLVDYWPRRPQEELVAELTASIVCARLHFGTVLRDDHRAFVSDWLRLLTRRPRDLLWIIGEAQAAASMILPDSPSSRY